MVNLCKQFYDTCFNLLDGRVLLIQNVVPRARGTGGYYHHFILGSNKINKKFQCKNVNISYP